MASQSQIHALAGKTPSASSTKSLKEHNLKFQKIINARQSFNFAQCVSDDTSQEINDCRALIYILHSRYFFNYYFPLLIFHNMPVSGLRLLFTLSDELLNKLL